MWKYVTAIPRTVLITSNVCWSSREALAFTVLTNTINAVVQKVRDFKICEILFIVSPKAC